jgi:hypothetical protein
VATENLQNLVEQSPDDGIYPVGYSGLPPHDWYVAEIRKASLVLIDDGICNYERHVPTLCFDDLPTAPFSR